MLRHGTMHSVHLVIRGRVQGVGFRYFAQREARTLGVHGVARNLPNGTVEVQAEGERESLERLVEMLRHGPFGARVTGVEERWSEGPARHQGFEIGPDRW